MRRIDIEYSRNKSFALCAQGNIYAKGSDCRQAFFGDREVLSSAFRQHNFQQLYNLADSFVAGKFIGDNALAAVGNSYEITLIFIAFAFGCNIGCSVIVSRLFGAKKNTDLKTAVFTTWIASAAVCAILMVIGLTLSTPLLKLINTPDELLADSKLYLDIYVWGLPFVFFYNVSTGIFAALGDSKTPFVFLAVSSLANIGVDILFVATFKWAWQAWRGRPSYAKA